MRAGEGCTGEANVIVGQAAGVFNETAENVSNHCIFGSKQFPLNDVYFGSGNASDVPTDYVIHGAGAKGNNIGGGNITIAAGQGTGTGRGGDILYQTAPAGGAGAVKNALVDRMRILESGEITMLSLKSGTLAAPPGGLVSGELWEDTTDSAVQPIVRIKA